MVTWKETHAVIIALHKAGFTGKDIDAGNITSKSVIYQIIKNFQGRRFNCYEEGFKEPKKSPANSRTVS